MIGCVGMCLGGRGLSSWLCVFAGTTEYNYSQNKSVNKSYSILTNDIIIPMTSFSTIRPRR